VPYGQKYTPTDCFFGDFAYWPTGINILGFSRLISYKNCIILFQFGLVIYLQRTRNHSHIYFVLTGFRA